MQNTENLIIYDINLPSFFDSDGDGIGDLIGVMQQLPYVSSLGVTCISLGKVFERSDLDSIYATTDFRKTDLRFGDMNDLESLISSAHEAGLTVLLPIPICAVSPSHPWFVNASSFAARNEYNLYKDYFIWKKEKTKVPSKTRKYFCNDSTGEWYLATEDGYPILNLDNPRVRREITDTIEFWRQKGFDAFSLVGVDLSIKIAEVSSENNTGKISEDIFEVGREAYKVLRDIREKGVLGDGCELYLTDTTIDDNTIPYLLGDPLLADKVERTKVIEETEYDNKEKFKLATFLDRCLRSSSPQIRTKICNVFEDSEHERLLAHLLTRPEHHSSATKAMSLLFFTLPGIHRVHQGQEIGMLDRLNGKKPTKDLPMQWDNRMNAGFTAARFSWRAVHANYSRINVVSEELDSESPLHFFRNMIAFRNANPMLISADTQVIPSGRKDVCAFLRVQGDEKLFIVCSFSDKEINFALPAELLRERSECILSNYSIVSKSLHKTIGLRPYEARIYAFNTVKKDVKLLR